MKSIADMPKIELHCHLDGSILPGTACRELAKQGILLTEAEAAAQMIVSPDCKDLDEYLAGFAVPLKCVQTREGLREAAYDLGVTCAAENIRYFETRFAPSSCQVLGLSVKESIEAVREGLKQAQAETGVLSGIIVCGMRHLPAEVNTAMAKEARELLGDGVVCLDLAGGEAGHSNLEMKEFFDFARKTDFPFVIHSGECGSASNVREAVELGAKRIGHGIAIAGHAELMKLCADRRVLLELCPTSNLQTRIIHDIHRFPLPEFLSNHVPVCVNTDNRTVSDTSLTKELQLMEDTFHLPEELYRRMYRDAAEASFAPDDVKHQLLSLW